MRLRGLGYEPIFKVSENPLPYMDTMLSAKEHTNFFENRVTEYTKAATTGSWEDVFNKMDKKKVVKGKYVLCPEQA